MKYQSIICNLQFESCAEYPPSFSSVLSLKILTSRDRKEKHILIGLDYDKLDMAVITTPPITFISIVQSSYLLVVHVLQS